MRIALDYDDCVDRDPPLFAELVLLFLKHGHQIDIVTSRRFQTEISDIIQFVPETALPMNIYYTNGQAKQDWASEKGIHYDIWIDDKPVLIVQDCAWRKP